MRGIIIAIDTSLTNSWIGICFNNYVTLSYTNGNINSGNDYFISGYFAADDYA
jgi:hypothetical protein